MSRRARLSLFTLAGPGLAAVLVLGFRRLPPFGDYHGVYGFVVNGVALAMRHATDFVTALNFDIRAFDTLGEEFILFTSVIGVSMLLRELRDEGEEKARTADDHRFQRASDALRAASLVFAPLLIALGWYVILHGALTPGGGFQGGIVFGAALLSALLAGRYLAMRRLAPKHGAEVADALGAAAYAVIGLVALIAAGTYMQNFLALGKPGFLNSAGLIPINSVAVGVEVAGAFLVIWLELLDQALVVRRR